MSDDTEKLKRWLEAGRELAERNPSTFRQLLGFADASAVHARLEDRIAEREGRVRVSIHVDAEDLARWRRIAGPEERDLDAWIAELCNAAAGGAA